MVCFDSMSFPWPMYGNQVMEIPYIFHGIHIAENHGLATENSWDSPHVNVMEKPWNLCGPNSLAWSWKTHGNFVVPKNNENLIFHG